MESAIVTNLETKHALRSAVMEYENSRISHLLPQPALRTQNPKNVIKTAADTASLVTNMQGSPHLPDVCAEPSSVGSSGRLHFRHWGGCASSQLDHAVDLQALQLKFISLKGKAGK